MKRNHQSFNTATQLLIT